MPRRTTYLSLPTAFFYSLFHCTSLPFPLSSAVFRRSLSPLFLLFKRVTASRAVSVPPESTRPSYASRNLSRRVRSKVVQIVIRLLSTFDAKQYIFPKHGKENHFESFRSDIVSIESSMRSKNGSERFLCISRSRSRTRTRTIGIVTISYLDKYQNSIRIFIYTYVFYIRTRVSKDGVKMRRKKEKKKNQTNGDSYNVTSLEERRKLSN